MASRRRDLIVLGVGANEFLVRAEGEAADVREGLTRLLPDQRFALEPLNERTTQQLESRLSESQLETTRKLYKTAGVRASRKLASYRLTVETGQLGVVATATPTGVLKFVPRISEVRKPLGGGIGPVGVTVGVGIAGKF